MSRRTLAVVAVAGAAAGVAFRVWAALLPQGALDADEAVVGLLARGIVHGTFPVFFPGQGYGGTQEAYLAAPLVAAFGLHAWAIRIVVAALWAASAVLVWRIGLRVLDERRAVFAAVLFWVWPAYFDWKSTRAHGFYGSELFLGLAVLLLVLRLAERVSRRDLVLLGLALGCGLWSSPQIAIVALPSLAWLVWSRRDVLRGWAYVLVAAVVGGMPWLLGNLRHDWYSLHPGRNEGTWRHKLALGGQAGVRRRQPSCKAARAGTHSDPYQLLQGTALALEDRTSGLLARRLPQSLARDRPGLLG